VPAAESLLMVHNLEVTYHRKLVAIRNVSVTAPAGSVVGVIGINGAGKTTLLRAISGFLPGEDVQITEGDIVYKGRSIKGLEPHETCSLGIALVPERDKVFPTLTVEENLKAARWRANGSDGRTWHDTLEQIFEWFPLLKERRRLLAGYLSGGERQMLAFGMALINNPSLLLVDEMSLGLAPSVLFNLAEHLQIVRAELGLTVLMVDQFAQMVIRMSDYCYVMENGGIVFDGPPERLLAHADVREFYLGMTDSAQAAKSYREVKQYRRRRRWYG
jgi:branched-chain amino acid transport system ATP-binding protein